MRGSGEERPRGWSQYVDRRGHRWDPFRYHLPTPRSHLPTCLLAWAQDWGESFLPHFGGTPPQTHLTGFKCYMSNGSREGLSSDCSEGYGQNPCMALWGGGVTVTLRPQLPLPVKRRGRRGRAPLPSPPACPSSSVSISLKSVLTCCVRSAGPEVRRLKEMLERGAVCMGKHTSTCKNMIPSEMPPGPTGRHGPRQHKVAGFSRPPQQGLCVWWKARPAWEDLLHLICAKGGYTCFAGEGGMGRGGRGL